MTMPLTISASGTVGEFSFSFSMTKCSSPVVITGPNGAGKSTVVRAIAGLIEGAKTRVDVGGDVLSLEPPERRRVGYVPQRSLLFPHLSVEQNVMFGPLRGGTSPADAKLKAVSVLDLLEVSHLRDRYPAGLSGGEAKRVAIARALASGPRLLLLDEPTAALDVEVRASMRKLLVERAMQAGFAIVMVSHDVRDAVALDAQVAVMNAGKIAQCGPVAMIRQSPQSAFAEAWAASV